MITEIQNYNDSLNESDTQICNRLCEIIAENMPESTSKIWHAHLVWFLDENPIVGYKKLKECVRLLFWSGQSFEEEGLDSVGSFMAAEKRYTDVSQISEGELIRWTKKSKQIQWDYKNIVKRKGELLRLK